MECLELCGGHVTDLGVQHICHLRVLSSLSLAQNFRITDRSALHLASLSRLTSLNLNQSKFTGNGTHALHPLKVCS